MGALTCVYCSWNPEEDVRVPGTEDTDGCKPRFVCW